jgi:hypothetical protein
MKVDPSQLSLTELCDKLSELTATYSKSMLNGFSEKEFTELRSMIEGIQMEISKRKSAVTSRQSTESTKSPPPGSSTFF